MREEDSLKRMKELWEQSGDDDVLRAYQDIDGCRPEARPIVREEAIKRHLVHVDDSGEPVITEKAKDVQFEIDQRTSRVILLKIGKTVAVVLFAGLVVGLIQASTGSTATPTGGGCGILAVWIFAIWRKKSRPAPPPKEDTVIRREHHEGLQGGQK
jgi:hypothetical protein